MIDKNYFKNIIIAKISFIIKYFRVFRLLAVIIYLVYLEMLIINVFSVVEYIPSSDEVKGRFIPITAKREVIDSIEGYFFEKKNNLIKNAQKEIKNNRFMPYKTDDLDFIGSDTGSENDVIN